MTSKIEGWNAFVHMLSVVAVFDEDGCHAVKLPNDPKEQKEFETRYLGG